MAVQFDGYFIQNKLTQQMNLLLFLKKSLSQKVYLATHTQKDFYSQLSKAI